MQLREEGTLKIAAFSTRLSAMLAFNNDSHEDHCYQDFLLGILRRVEMD